VKEDAPVPCIPDILPIAPAISPRVAAKLLAVTAFACIAAVAREPEYAISLTDPDNAGNLIFDLKAILFSFYLVYRLKENN
jgi:hypothetical protein